LRVGNLLSTWRYSMKNQKLGGSNEQMQDFSSLWESQGLFAGRPPWCNSSDINKLRHYEEQRTPAARLAIKKAVSRQQGISLQTQTVGTIWPTQPTLAGFAPIVMKKLKRNRESEWIMTLMILFCFQELNLNSFNGNSISETSTSAPARAKQLCYETIPCGWAHYSTNSNRFRPIYHYMLNNL